MTSRDLAANSLSTGMAGTGPTRADCAKGPPVQRTVASMGASPLAASSGRPHCWQNLFESAFSVRQAAQGFMRGLSIVSWDLWDKWDGGDKEWVSHILNAAHLSQ